MILYSVCYAKHDKHARVGGPMNGFSVWRLYCSVGACERCQTENLCALTMEPSVVTNEPLVIGDLRMSPWSLVVCESVALTYEPLVMWQVQRSAPRARRLVRRQSRAATCQHVCATLVHGGLITSTAKFALNSPAVPFRASKTFLTASCARIAMRVDILLLTEYATSARTRAGRLRRQPVKTSLASAVVSATRATQGKRAAESARPAEQAHSKQTTDRIPACSVLGASSRPSWGPIHPVCAWIALSTHTR